MKKHSYHRYLNEYEVKSKFKMLLDAIKSENIHIFKDQFGNPWAGIPENHCFSNVPVHSERFKSFLVRLFFRKFADGIGNTGLTQVQRYLEAEAENADTRKLACRCTMQDQKVIIDLAGVDYSAVIVTADGWEVSKLESSPFKRFRHMKQLPEPLAGGNLHDLFDFLNIKKESEKILVLVWLVTAFIPDVARPGIILHGLQGSGKTSCAALLRELIDPSVTSTLSLPKNHAEFVQMLAHHYVVALDNVGRLPQWASDALCRALTGNGFSKRKLYTDDEDIVYRFHRTFMITGIEIPGTSPDLLDRSIIFELERISKKDRKALRDIGSQYHAEKGKLFGAILDALSAAMKIKHHVSLEELPRMADWCEWGAAVAEALGIGQDKFLQAYLENIKGQHRQILQSEPVDIAIAKFMENRHIWEGTPSELYREVVQIAENFSLRKEKEWPKAANAFSRRLDLLSHNLSECGLVLSKSRSKSSRKIRLERVNK